VTQALREALRVLRRLRFYVALEILRPMPLGWAARVLRFQARANYYLRPWQRSRATAALQRIAPDRPDAEKTRLVRQMFTYQAFNDSLSHLILIRDANDHRDLITVQGWDRVEQALGRNRGVVLLTSHLGMPSAERWFLRTQKHPVLYVYRVGFPGVQDTSWRETFQRWHRNRYGMESDDLVGNEEFSLQYLKKAYDHLRRNGIVNIAGTGRKGGGRRYAVTFGGRQRTMADGGISLGLLAGAALVPCFTYVDEAPHFRIEFQEPLACPPGNHAGQTLALVEAYAARIGDFMSRYPAMTALRPHWISSPRRQQ
jgi:lauroyl/myristoyl acyltransferase